MAHDGPADDAGLGLAHGMVRLAPPTPRWAALFDAEAAAVRAALAAHAPVVEHCGSTGVPGLPAKPILDLLVGVPAPLDVPALARALAPLGYAHAPHAGVPGHEVFGKGDPRTHLLHVVPLHGDAWRRMLRFRDALRADAALAAEYAALKRALAARHPTERAAYTAGKDAFIARVLDAPDAPPT
jgi:GrpB-like predicted nucleotidyltransferase (UPF0157 family)